MARPLRIEYPGAWYHVMNRGAGKKDIFHADTDFDTFLQALKEMHRRYQIKIHAYCLMPNHYHLLLETPLANLSRAMKYLNGVYTQRYNKIYKTDGALLRGRFKSIVIDANDYLLTLSRYIHLNPVVAKLVQRPEQYKWSSCCAYDNTKLKPDWLMTEGIFNRFGNKHQKQKYRIFMQEKLQHKENSIFEKIKRIPVLGSDAFVKKVMEKSLNSDKSVIQKSDISLPSIDEIMDAVAVYYKVNKAVLRQIGNRTLGNKPRSVAIYLACMLSQAETRAIAEKFSNISMRGVLKAMNKVKSKRESDVKLEGDINELTSILVP